MTDLLLDLNGPQREAVLASKGPLLVLAGAGSGKTRVITHRVAHLVTERKVPPWKILAVTFTNKAAKEMQERLAKLLGETGNALTVRTFHSFAAMTLRREAEHAGIARNFVIYDDSDQIQVARRAIREAGIANGWLTPREALSFIEGHKNAGRLPDAVPTEALAGDPDKHRQLRQVYGCYQRLLRTSDAVDFGDLLLLLVESLSTNEELRLRYQRRYEYVLVDEFQDTNPVQYQLLKLLAPPPTANLVVVGDDDQSIYRWRGAEVGNILDFPATYPGCKQIKLEQNYRSDQNILEAAHAVIRRNERRMPKKLWSAKEPGSFLGLIQAPDERHEALAIAEQVAAFRRNATVDFNEIAVFFRANAQSRILEETLRTHRIPYILVSGRSFYERAEVKDAVSYLRLMLNPRSDADVLRIINVPVRGIGETTTARLVDYATARGMSLYEALGDIRQIPSLNAGAQRRLEAFHSLLLRLVAAAATSTSATEAGRAMFDETRLIAVLEEEGTDEAAGRAENLRELLSATFEFDAARSQGENNGILPSPRREMGLVSPAAPKLWPRQGDLFAPAPRPGEETPNPAFVTDFLEESPLLAFLEQLSLLGDVDGDSGQGAGRVSLMTLHAAKGLEFDAVFLTGMEEGVFPHRRAVGENADPENLAEERRLCYVGFTRARHHLTLTLAQSRTMFGDLKFNAPSRFLTDVPEDLFGDVELLRGSASPLPRAARISRRPSREPTVDRTYDQRSDWEHAKPIGKRVTHSVFGTGRIVDVRESGPQAKLVVDFESVGRKTVVARFLQAVA